MPQIYIDNKPYEVKAGKNLLEACLTLGFDLPYFCWHPALGSVGACRQCAIKVYKDENDKQGRLIMSCMEPVADKQRISIKDTDAVEFREHVIEWLMTNHPHDCAVCDEGGSCHLQDMTVMTGHTYRNFEFKKRTYKNQYLGPFINHEMNRCIQCYRCVRFYKDYAGGHDLDAFASRNRVYFGRHEEGVLENEFSGNLSEICPTGVFTDKTLKQHYTRKWDLTMAPSVCHHCSLGCNIIAGERYGGLRMVANRYNGDVNGYFICDRGRFGYEFVNAEDRIREPIINGETLSKEKWLSEFGEKFKNKKLIGIGSSRASLESNYTLKKLVGEENFYVGESDHQRKLNDLAYKILKESPARAFSMKEVEKSDAVFVLGEDLTNTAPMLALAVRQAIRQEPIQEALQTNIPIWNDAAVRGVIQDKKGPCYVATISATKLDEVSKKTFNAAPQDLARLGHAVANCIDPSAPSVSDLSKGEQELAQELAKDLLNAKMPVVISGTSAGDADVMKAASNIAKALHAKNDKAGIVMTLPECNSMGASMLGGKNLSEALKAAKDADAVVVLENDLYLHAGEKELEIFFSNAKGLIAIDHTPNQTTKQATHLLPAGSFAEADGTLVSNEGRAQRFFQVYQPHGNINESWRWIIALAKALGNKEIAAWENIDPITEAIGKSVEGLKGIEQVSPKSDFRVNGQKIPRAPHRYSGRTAMNAQLEVSELKPLEDPDSPMSYTMEGLRPQSPTHVIPFFWSPGWNSVQSVNKYQEEVGGALRAGNAGLRMIVSEKSAKYYDTIPAAFNAAQKLVSVPLHHIFGSEELSAKAPAVAQRVPAAYVAVSKHDAEKIGVENRDKIEVDIGERTINVLVMVDPSLPKGVVGIPSGLRGIGFVEYFKEVKIKKS